MGDALDELLPWDRWLFPVSSQIPILDDGFLDDPAGPFAHLIESETTLLSGLDGVRLAVVIFGESGVGKSTLLRIEAERRRMAGGHVALLDLAGLDRHDVREEIAAAFEETDDPISLMLDGFDQTMIEIVALGRVIRKALEPRRSSVHQIVVAARRALWDDAVEAALPTWASEPARYVLAPLTRAQVREAAGVVLQDPDGFIAKVEAARVGAMAAHPISLELLLEAAQREQLPATRMQVYDLGVAGLAEEGSSAHPMDPPLNLRMAGAQRLATPTLLSGHGRVRRRQRAGQDANAVALEQVVSGTVTLDVLEAVFRSSLLKGAGDDRTWMHRSIEEYLCARQLVALPRTAVQNLLEHPSEPGGLRPQFAGVAAWLAALDDAWFWWVLERRYEVLFNPDLPARSPTHKRQVAAALIRHIQRDDLPYLPDVALDSFSSSLDYRGLAYDGIESDLAPLLDPGQPTWRTREALIIVVANDLRGLDEQLLALVEHAAGHGGPEDYGPVIQVGVHAAIALRGCSDPFIVARAKTMAADSSVPWTMRLELLRWLLASYAISVADLARFVPPNDRWAGQGAFVWALGTLLFARSRECGAEDVDLLRFIAQSPALCWQHETVTVGADLILSAIRETEPGDDTWRQAAALAATWINKSPRQLLLAKSDLDEVDTERRRIFARDVLNERGGGTSIRQMIELGMIRPDDLSWWLNELVAAVSADVPALSTANVIEQLASHAPTVVALDQMHTLATAVASQNATAQEFVQGIFNAEASARHTVARQFDGPDQAPDHRPSLSDQTQAALGASDPATILTQLWHHLHSRESGPYVMWEALPESQAARLVATASQYLHEAVVDAGKMADRDRLFLAYGILLSIAPDVLDTVPGDRWLAWLPHLLGVLGVPEADWLRLQAMQASVKADAVRTEQILIDALADPFSVYVIDGHETPAVSDAALARTNQPNLDADYLRALLDRAQAHRPDEAADVALHYIRRRPPSVDIDRSWASPQFNLAVEAAVALVAMPSLRSRFTDLLEEFRNDDGFAWAVLVKAQKSGTRDLWNALGVAQLVELYLWARDAFPASALPAPGTAISGYRVEEFANEVICRLSAFGEPDEQLPAAEPQQAQAAAHALRDLADRTGDVWIRQRARRLHDAILGAGKTATIAEILAAIDETDLHIVTSPEQLLTAATKAIDELQEELLSGRALRAQFWQQQRPAGECIGYVPLEETALSDWLTRYLRIKLGAKIALFREVEIQPRLGETEGDVPDILAIALTTETSQVEIIVEVKCNWNDDVRNGLESQLAKRYLAGPRGRVGLYLVGFYRGTSWLDSDPRKRKARKRLDYLTSQLEDDVERIRLVDDLSIEFRVLDLNLDGRAIACSTGSGLSWSCRGD